MLCISNVLDVHLTYDNKSILCVVELVIYHHVGNNRFNLVFAKTAHPNEHVYFETMLDQPSFAILMHSLAYGMVS